MHKSLTDLLTENRIITDLHAKGRWGTIDELLNKLIEARALEPGSRSKIAAAVRKREQSMSTGIGFGIGIPHASSDCLSEAVAALGRSKGRMASTAGVHLRPPPSHGGALI